MSTASVVWRVARREIRARMLTRANIVSMVVILLLIAIGTAVASYFMNRDTGPDVARVALAREVSDLGPELEAAAAQRDVDLELSTLTAAEAEPALMDASGDGPAALDAFLEGDPGRPRMLVASEPDGDVLALVEEAVASHVRTEQITALGGDPEGFARATAAAVPQVAAVEEPDADLFDDGAFGVAIAMISLLFGALIGTGSMIAMGVVEEKTSRVVEILLSTIRPAQLLAGKILGVGVYGLAQMVVLGGALAVAGSVLGAADLDIDVGSALAMLVVWFLLGYVLFALLFGGFAALVSRQEEIGSVTTPLTFSLLVPFYVTMFLVPNDPDSTLVRVLSQIPFFAPFMMPVRDAFGALQPWEMPLAIAICLLTIPALIWLAGRVYQRGVLHTGGRMRLKDAVRA